jgi:hypothetical protein
MKPAIRSTRTVDSFEARSQYGSKGFGRNYRLGNGRHSMSRDIGALGHGMRFGWRYYDRGERWQYG